MAYYQPTDIHVNSELELCIKEIISFIKPAVEDTLKRQIVINELEGAIRTDQSLIRASVTPFGSFVSNLYTRWGDLDISIDLIQSTSSFATRRHELNILQKIKQALQRTGIAREIEFVRHARVPVVVYQSKNHNISCDISINNHAGYVKSHVLRLISNIDARFPEFVLLVKEFAKAQHINDPRMGTLNSYSLCLLIIFHFQICRPAIFPPLKDLYEGNIVDDFKGRSIMHVEDSYAAKIARYRSQISGQGNQSSICQLLISFFDKVEDPFEQTENAARAVDAKGLTEISKTFTNMYRKLSSRSMPMDRTSLLNNLVRPEIRSKLNSGKQPICDQFQKPWFI